ncbi:PASTA domain-containing protein [Pseudonocardia nigra]|uniref:PASTA domain-containing protein n=1 Tax=Pseudonocardia nigra TaxID=1921578 RepID=UPI001C5FBAAE|nr:PASTA domain-containing protein [Pseudonocardia nigra]
MTEAAKALVPALVGLDVAQAHELAMSARVAVVGPDPDITLPLDGVVTGQQPLAGIEIPAGDPVTVWVETRGNDGGDDGGGGGGGGSARDPDRPRPLDPSGVK